MGRDVTTDVRDRAAALVAPTASHGIGPPCAVSAGNDPRPSGRVVDVTPSRLSGACVD
jgi:hypothetical protein